MKKSITLASDITHRGSKAFNDNGELNAASTRDAMRMLASLAEGGQIAGALTDKEATAEEARAKEVAAVARRREAVQEAMADTSGETHRDLGVELAGTINESTTRLGIMRQVLKFQNLNQGERPEIDVQDKNVTVVVSSGATQVQTQIVRDNYVSPPEVDIQARPFIEKRAIDRTRTDLLQRKLAEAEEQILVGEDRLFKIGVDRMIAAHNREAVHIGSEMSPDALGTGIDLITGYNVPLDKILFAANLWTKMMYSREFENLIDPVTRLEILRTGRVGSINGAQLLTDAYREPNQKVLNPNETYYFSVEDFVGEYTDRGGVESTPIGVAETGVAGLGWHLVESLSLGLVNHRGVAKTTLTQ